MHEPGLSSIYLFTPNCHWDTAALLFVSAISLPFTLTSSQVFASRPLCGPPHFEGLFIFSAEGTAHKEQPCTHWSLHLVFCCSWKGMKIYVACSMLKDLYLKSSKRWSNDILMNFKCSCMVQFSESKPLKRYCSLPLPTHTSKCFIDQWRSILDLKYHSSARFLSYHLIRDWFTLGFLSECFENQCSRWSQLSFSFAVYSVVLPKRNQPKPPRPTSKGLDK